MKRTVVCLISFLLLPFALTASVRFRYRSTIHVMIKVLQAETVPLQIDSSTVTAGCGQADYSASCMHASDQFVQNVMVVQSEDGRKFTIACTIESRWSNCIPLPVGESFRARIGEERPDCCLSRFQGPATKTASQGASRRRVQCASSRELSGAAARPWTILVHESISRVWPTRAGAKSCDLENERITIVDRNFDMYEKGLTFTSTLGVVVGSFWLSSTSDRHIPAIRLSIYFNFKGDAGIRLLWPPIRLI